jgi:hypothetical protein
MAGRGGPASAAAPARTCFCRCVCSALVPIAAGYRPARLMRRAGAAARSPLLRCCRDPGRPFPRARSAKADRPTPRLYGWRVRAWPALARWHSVGAFSGKIWSNRLGWSPGGRSRSLRVAMLRAPVGPRLHGTARLDRRPRRSQNRATSHAQHHGAGPGPDRPCARRTERSNGRARRILCRLEAQTRQNEGEFLGIAFCSSERQRAEAICRSIPRVTSP